MNTPTQDDLNAWAASYGEDIPERPWILTPWDVWEKNPHYTGPEVAHPEEEMAREDAAADLHHLRERRGLSHENLPEGSPAAESLPHVRAAIKRALAAGFSLAEVGDGEEDIPVTTMDEALDAIFAVEEAVCYFTHPDERDQFWVLFILCNGEDAMSDFGARDTDAGRAFDKAMMGS